VVTQYKRKTIHLLHKKGKKTSGYNRKKERETTVKEFRLVRRQSNRGPPLFMKESHLFEGMDRLAKRATVNGEKTRPLPGEYAFAPRKKKKKTIAKRRRDKTPSAQGGANS